MKIAQIAPVWYPIPPTGYGGIELVVSLLTEGLVKNGHEVTIFASGDSHTTANLTSVFDEAPSSKIGQVYPELYHCFQAYNIHEKFDLIHDHSGQIGPVIGSFISTPVHFTLHGPATDNALKLFGGLDKKVSFNSISEYQRNCFKGVNIIDTVYNAIDINQYPFNEDAEDYLLFLGRMSKEKGAHIAVKIANQLSMKLIMVTKINEPHERKYFVEAVQPLIRENVLILGEIDRKRKAELYGKAYCTLFPIQWPEPFGLVMVESMATGTPVVATRNGATPEVIEDKETGFIVDDIDEMIEAVKKVEKIDRNKCRQLVKQRFTSDIMVEEYEKLYQKIISDKS